MEKNYNYYDKVLSIDDYSLSDYKERINLVMSIGGRKYGKYRKYAKNGKYGTIDDFGRWSFLNTINTHRFAFMYICQLYEEKTGMELDFSTRTKRLESYDLIKDFLIENYEKYFTMNETPEYYTNFELFCNKSWMGGVIDNITFLYFIGRLFPDIKIKKIIWDTERGNPDDFNGVDIRIIFVTGASKTIQIKRGRLKELTSENYLLDGAFNNFSKEVDYYGYVDLDLSKDYVEVFMFEHNKSYMVDFNNVKVPINSKIKTFKEYNMVVPKMLLSILTFCYENKIIFNLAKEGEKNDVTFTNTPRREVNVIISDFKDENLGTFLTDKFKELQEFFK